ncbi:hypothetical protein D9M68_874540 [compost metagenome]|uniref:Uncharacterized protein n=1 Tax=Achromobacter agilis TaxID=1353888 RepID=A0A446CXM5_9BURK|nr:hypothetical protein AGI3411_05643 [Achromobacter agilis]
MSTEVMTSLSLLLRSLRMTSGVRIGPSLLPVTVMTSVAVSVAPWASDTVYVMEVVAVWPAARYWKAEPGLKV